MRIAQLYSLSSRRIERKRHWGMFCSGAGKWRVGLYVGVRCGVGLQLTVPGWMRTNTAVEPVLIRATGTPNGGGGQSNASRVLHVSTNQDNASGSRTVSPV